MVDSASASADLSSRIRAGDRRAEAELIAEFAPRIRRIILSRTGDSDVTNDLSQDVLLATIEALRDGRLRKTDCLAAYIQGVVRHTVSAFFRRRAARGEVTFENEHAAMVFDDAASAERRAAIRRGLQHLEASDRAILHWLLVEGLTHQAIAARLQLKPAAVRQRKSRALRRIRFFVQGTPRFESTDRAH